MQETKIYWKDIMSFENMKFIHVQKFDSDQNNELNKISKSNKVQTNY
jgi:hypothetical protein